MVDNSEKAKRGRSEFCLEIIKALSHVSSINEDRAARACIIAYTSNEGFATEAEMEPVFEAFKHFIHDSAVWGLFFSGFTTVQCKDGHIEFLRQSKLLEDLKAADGAFDSVNAGGMLGHRIQDDDGTDEPSI